VPVAGTGRASAAAVEVPVAGTGAATAVAVEANADSAAAPEGVDLAQLRAQRLARFDTPQQQPQQR
ncbi:unnamed protein product, partial [Polarella glacialis]